MRQVVTPHETDSESPDMDERTAGWHARYHAGADSDGVPVTVTVDRLGIHFEMPGGTKSWWPHSVVQLSPDPANRQHTRVEKGGTGEALVVLGTGILEALQSRSPRAQRGASTASSGWQKIAMLIFGSIGLIAALYFVVLPAMAGVMANRVSVEFERELGDGVMEQLLVGESVCDDPTLTRSVGDIVARLGGGLPDDRYDFRITIVDDPMVNALAVPGGAIVVFRGLLQNSATPEELAGVLAHEMQHVQLRHGTRAIMRQLPLLMGGGSDAAAVLGVLGALSYARADEEEADAEGMRLILAARVDPRGMISFFETLERLTGSSSGMLTYLSTHPATAERRAALAALADASPVAAEPISTGEIAWSELVQRCRASV
jgi:Zn-dependent protease with chaperone function